MAGFMIGRQFPFPIADDFALAFRSGHHPFTGFLKFRHLDALLVAPGGQQSGLIYEIAQVCSRESRCPAGQHIQVNFFSNRLAFRMNLQDFLPSAHIRTINSYLPIKSSGTQQSWIENIRPIGSGNDNNALIDTKTVHLHKKLVEGLFPLVMSAAEAGAALAANGINLIDEHDTGSVLFGLLK